MCLAPGIKPKPYRNLTNPLVDATDTFPCQKCVICLKRRQNAWAFRLQEEAKISTSAVFLTLTYETAPKSFNGHDTLVKSDFQKFMKRLRRSLGKSRIKYYACGEYGTETLRPHYHAIIFNLPDAVKYSQKFILKNWQHGHIDLVPATYGRIRYVTKYVMKGKFEPLTDCDDRQPEFPLMSKKMGLNHLTPQMVKYYTENLISYVTLPGGTLTPLPRYFRDKIFSREERRIMNIEAQAIRDFNFQKLFNDSFKQELLWKKDQVRKANKEKLLTRRSI